VGDCVTFQKHHIYRWVGIEIKKHAKVRAIQLNIVRANSGVVVVGWVVCVVWSTLTFGVTTDVPTYIRLAV
jgi:hypothetical protein